MKWTDLDLKISLSPSQAAVLPLMVKKFLSREQHYFCEPVIEGNVLKINSSDFINFLDQATFTNEFDLFRLKASALKAIAHVRSKKKDQLVVQHYKKCEMIVRELTFGND